MYAVYDFVAFPVGRSLHVVYHMSISPTCGFAFGYTFSLHMHLVTPTLLLVVSRLQAYRLQVGTIKREKGREVFGYCYKACGTKTEKSVMSLPVPILLQKP